MSCIKILYFKTLKVSTVCDDLGAMSSAGVGPLSFLKTNVTGSRLPRHFGALHSSFW